MYPSNLRSVDLELEKKILDLVQKCLRQFFLSKFGGHRWSFCSLCWWPLAPWTSSLPGGALGLGHRLLEESIPALSEGHSQN